MVKTAAEPTHDRNSSLPDEGAASFLVLANRLPVRRVTTSDGAAWETSPGGLVTALAPVMAGRDDAMWLGWSGTTGTEGEDPLVVDGIAMVPVPLSRGEVELFYEGFANRTLWPLYHDSIVRSEYHRTWWDAYRSVNRRFAKTAARWAGWVAAAVIGGILARFGEELFEPVVSMVRGIGGA